jgi:uncharacterized phage protein (TIGR01671 family)
MNHRELKFRVWDIESKTWCELECVIGSNYDIVNDPDKFIIQQFTELYDKNKKSIYEGDIVNVQRSFTRPYVKDGKIDYKTIDGGLEVGQVIWWEVEAAFLIAYKGYDDMDDFRYLSYSYEVIGNIFEHSELLNK